MLSQSEQLLIDHFGRSIAEANLRKRSTHAAHRRHKPNRRERKHSQEQQDRLQILTAHQQDRSNSHHRTDSKSINGQARNRSKEGQRSQGIGKAPNMVVLLLYEERAAAR